MMIHLLAVTGPSDREFLNRFLAPDCGRTPAQVERVVALMHNHGSVEYATDYAAAVARLAEERFEVAFGPCPDSPARDFLRALVPFMVDRPR